MTIIEKFHQGRAFEQKGQFYQAWETYTGILQDNRLHVPTLKQLAGLAYQQQQYTQAEQFYEQILSVQPLQSEIWYRLGKVKYQLKEAKAITCFRKVLELHPRSDKKVRILAKLQLAKALKQAKQKEEALSITEKLYLQHPKNPQIITLLAELKQLEGQKEMAYQLFQQAVHFAPQKAATQLNLGVSAKILGKPKEAILAFEKCLTLQPNWEQPYRELAACYQQLGKADQAWQLLQKVLEIAPHTIENYLALCHWCEVQGEYIKGIKIGQQLLKIAPNHPTGNTYMGHFLLQLSYTNKAVGYLKKGYEQTLNASTAYEIGNTLHGLNDFEEATVWFKKAISEDTHFYAAHYALINRRMDVADWSQRQKDKADLVQLLTQQIESEAFSIPLPYMTLTAMGIPSALNLRVNQFISTQYIKNIAALKKQIPTKRAQRHPKEILHIGYISPDFRKHPMGRLLSQLFQHHNRVKVKIFGYNLTAANKTDDYQEQFRQACDEFRDCFFDGTLEVVQKIQADAIDILVDLGGYTAHTRAGILALQAAPIQVSWLGYPNTMGADFIQYILADEWLIPTNLQSYYSEKISYLPQGFTGAPLPLSDLEITKTSEGLPNNSFIFCAFHRTEKISPAIFDCWLKILQAVPNSALWLNVYQSTTQANLSDYAENRGIARKRLIFAKKVDYPHFLQRLQLADLFLDTLAYSAGATAVAALNMGLPMVTCTADTYVSRMGASVLAAAQQENCIVDNLENYYEKAVAIATIPELHTELKASLSAPNELPLFNQATFAAQLEAAYFKMWDENN